MKLGIFVTYAAFSTERCASVEKLLAVLRPQCEAAGVPLTVWPNHDATSHLPGHIEAVRLAMLDKSVTHLCGLPDDAILVPHFVEVLQAAIAAKPDDVLDMVSNHGGAQAVYDQGARWYTTADGAILGTTMKASLWADYLRWREDALRDDVATPFDDGLHMWTAQRGHFIHKPLPSLAQHDLSLGSLCGNQWQTDSKEQRVLRESQVWEPNAALRFVDWSGPTVALPRSFDTQHWNAAWRLKPSAIDVEAIYRSERHGVPVDTKPHVFIATPAYGGPELAFLQSVARVAVDLQQNGYAVQHFMTGGDSLVTRGRHMLCHEFLRSTATHFLQWDADVEVQDPTAVRRMLESGHGIIGGAYPFRDGSGMVVANPLRETLQTQKLDIEDDCIKIAEVGTGFLLIRRNVLVHLMERHPELLYESDTPTFEGRPMWALFDVALEIKPNSGRKRYASEDWRFCSLARAAGHDVWCYLPPRFRHWGKHGHAGHITDAWHIGHDKAAAE